tara:strand:- start:345 stop:491 length:147 start_codon:yes stop_codon:yes gene_type:complete
MFPPIRQERKPKNQNLSFLCANKPNTTKIKVKTSDGEFQENNKKCFCF